MTLYGYISIPCLFACLSVFVTVHYGSPISDLPSPCWGWGGLYLSVCLSVCVSVCLCYRAIQTSVWLKLWVNWVMSVCLIVLHDHMDPVTQWPTFSLLWMRQVMLCNTCWVSGEYCSPTLTSLISPFWGQEGWGGDLDIFGASCSSFVYDMILSTDVIYNY